MCSSHDNVSNTRDRREPIAAFSMAAKKATSRKAPAAPAKRGRPRKDERGARERILAAAEELFYREGLHVGIDAIIGKAGVAKMSLYSHFDSKDALIVEFLKSKRDRWFTWFLAEIPKRATTPRERLLAMFDLFGEWFCTTEFRGCAFLNAATELPDPSHPARAIVADYKEQLRSWIEEQCREARLKNPRDLSTQIALILDGAISRAYVTGSRDAANVAQGMARRLLKDAAT